MTNMLNINVNIKIVNELINDKLIINTNVIFYISQYYAVITLAKISHM